MKIQTKWGIEVEAQRWILCPECGHEIEVPVFIDRTQVHCANCGADFLHTDVQHGRLKWNFLDEMSDELREQVLKELREDAAKWGATFTVTGNDQ